MELFTAWDLLLLEFGFVSFLVLAARSWIKGMRHVKVEPNFPLLSSRVTDTGDKLVPTRNIVKMLQQTGKRCIVFYGSQTGTAEKYAFRFAKDASTRYNLQCLVADLDDYDFDELNSLEAGQLAVFLLATYGEGEPTDSAIAFNHWLENRQARDTNTNATKFIYAAFGLGNSSYTFYNSMIRRVDSILSETGAVRIGDVGLGDDGKKTMEEDFNAWRINTLESIAQQYYLTELPYEFKADFQVTETNSSIVENVFHGEPNKLHLRNRTEGPFTARNPLPAKIVEAKQLFQSGQRHCLHLEFDVEGTTFNYETGDHLAVWPINSNSAVDDFLEVFGLATKRTTVVKIKSVDPSLKVPIPDLTTYEAIARHYLDIGAPVSRQLLATMAKLVVDETARAALVRYSTDVEVFHHAIAAQRLNLAQALATVVPGNYFHGLPFSFLLENVARLQPRYYSISSSSMAARKRISITAVVDSVMYPGTEHSFKGVNTNYLLALKADYDGQPSLTHQTCGPRGVFASPTTLIHVRKSTFRLPRSSTVPVIMIGPGTGVAPFRAFVQERALISSMGNDVARTMLFYGCRKSDEDFVYKDEWQQYQSQYPEGQFSLYTAFSRANEKKVYVQDLFRDHAEELKDLVLQQGAHVYVCGDASRMAKDVFKMFAGIIDSECKQSKDQSGEEYLKSMKLARRWSEDVW